MTDVELDRVEKRAAAPTTCLYCGGSGSCWRTDGESRCEHCDGTGSRPRDPEALDLVATVRRMREQIKLLQAALWKREPHHD